MGGFGRRSVAGSAGRYRNIANSKAQAIAVDAGESHIQHVRRTLGRMAIEADVGEPTQAIPQSIAQSRQLRALTIGIRQFVGFTHPDDLMGRERSRANPAVPLATVNHWRESRSGFDVQRADAFRAINLVRGERNEISAPGFDRDRDDVGDQPYELYSYADRIWMDVPAARFFKGSPVLEVMDFLERLAPFTEPNMLVRDDSPRMRADWRTEDADEASKQPSVPAPTGQPEAFDAYKALRESLGR